MKHQLILNLIKTAGVAAVAKKTGVNKRTLYRYIQQKRIAGVEAEHKLDKWAEKHQAQKLKAKKGTP